MILLITSCETSPEHFYPTPKSQIKNPRKPRVVSLPKANERLRPLPCLALPDWILPCITVAHPWILPYLTSSPRNYRFPETLLPTYLPTYVIRDRSHLNPSLHLLTPTATDLTPQTTTARTTTPTETIRTITRPRISNASLTSSFATLRIFLRRCHELRLPLWLCAAAGCSPFRSSGLSTECGSTWVREPRRSHVVSDGS